jgi:hypothetical protein
MIGLGFSHSLELERIFSAVILCQCFSMRCSNTVLISANLVDVEELRIKKNVTQSYHESKYQFLPSWFTGM